MPLTCVLLNQIQTWFFWNATSVSTGPHWNLVWLHNCHNCTHARMTNTNKHSCHNPTTSLHNNLTRLKHEIAHMSCSSHAHLFASLLVLHMMSCCHIRAVTSSQRSQNLKDNVTKCIKKKNGLRKKHKLSTIACSVSINWQSWNLPAWRLSNFSSCGAPVLTPHLHCRCLSFELAVLKIQHD